jgi:hypothetical protein
MCNLLTWLRVDLAGWAQALAALWLAVVTTWTLIVLRRYAADTKLIADNSALELESSQTPFISLIEGDMVQGWGPWKLKNQGNGVAINVRYSRHVAANQPLQMTGVTPLAPGESRSVSVESAVIFNGGETPFTITYESLSGKKYRTTVQRVQDEVRTIFEKLAQPE